jgi:hypothetical protein
LMWAADYATSSDQRQVVEVITPIRPLVG